MKCGPRDHIVSRELKPLFLAVIKLKPAVPFAFTSPSFFCGNIGVYVYHCSGINFTPLKQKKSCGVSFFYRPLALSFLHKVAMYHLNS